MGSDVVTQALNPQSPAGDSSFEKGAFLSPPFQGWVEGEYYSPDRSLTGDYVPNAICKIHALAGDFLNPQSPAGDSSFEKGAFLSPPFQGWVEGEYYSPDRSLTGDYVPNAIRPAAP